MDFNRINQAYATAPAADRATFDQGLRAHMVRVYNYMVTGLGVTGFVAAAVAYAAFNVPGVAQTLFGSPLQYVIMFAPLAFVFFISFRAHAMSYTAILGSFMAFSAVMGLSMASIFLVFSGESIARVFFITAAMFAATSIYGYTTKADLTKMGSFMIMGLFGIVIASIVNIFLGSDALGFAISVIGVVVFTGLTAWDTQRIKEEYSSNLGGELVGKMAVFGALSLYLNFINLFMMLLSLLGNRE